MTDRLGSGRRRSRRRVNTRARLVEAAEDVFVRKGLKRVTVDDLVGAAGFTRGAFYSNFSSIEEVFFARLRAAVPADARDRRAGSSSPCPRASSPWTRWA